MKTTKRLFLATAVAFGAFASLGTAQAQTALDDVMKAKTIKIAIPTDFPPYGFVGTDLAPPGQGQMRQLQPQAIAGQRRQRAAPQTCGCRVVRQPGQRL